MQNSCSDNINGPCIKKHIKIIQAAMQMYPAEKTSLKGNFFDKEAPQQLRGMVPWRSEVGESHGAGLKILEILHHDGSQEGQCPGHVRGQERARVVFSHHDVKISSLGK